MPPTKPMTPAEFQRRMAEIDKDIDQEKSHGDADNLMCEVLSQLGYEAGVEIFEKMDKWYS